MGHKSPTETKTYMHLTEDEFNTTMMRFTKSESTDFLSSLLSATNLSADKINAIKNIINN